MIPQSPNHHAAMPGHRRRMIRRAATFTAAVLALGGTPLVAVALGADAPAITEPTPTNETRTNWSPIERHGSAGAPTGRISALESRNVVRQLDADTETPDTETPDTETPDTETPDTETPDTDTEAANAIADAIVVLADSYQWDERSARVAVLQTNLDVVTDGWYSWVTLRAHREALEAIGITTDALPVPPPPPAPPAPARSESARSESAPSAPAPAAPAPAVSSGPSASAWAALRNCESGGNYSITNPSGKYRGAYQFDQPTWDSVARRHAPGLVGADPAGASPANQDAMARALYGERGSSPWPQCGRHL
jgi:hypothetical protein